MKTKRIIFIGLEIIVVFVLFWLLVQQPDISNENVFVIIFERFNFAAIRFWEDVILFVLAFGTSLIFWKRQTWNKQGKAIYLYQLFTSVFSLISLLLILAAIYFNAQIFFITFFILLITSLMISTTLYLITSRTKHKSFEFIKIIFFSIMVFGINLISNNIVSRSHHQGASWESMLLFVLFIAATASIASFIINFNILLTQLQRKE